MNFIAVAVLFCLVIQFAVELVANLLNLQALRLELPASLTGLYRAEDYRKSQEYVRVVTRFGLVRRASTLAVMLSFWLSGGFNWLDHAVRNWGFNPLVTGLLYIGMLSLAYGALELPFSIYGTFTIEKRFGFNRTTPRTFLLDTLKSLILGLLVGVPLLASLLALFQYAGGYAGLYAWAGIIVFSLVMLYVAPTFIMPLFNKFTPMEPGELKEAILKYTDSAGFPVKNVYVMDGSRRSTRSNAFFIGIGNSKRIALFDTLIAQHTVPEMVAVLAHEVGHYKKKHVLRSILFSILEMGVALFMLSVILNTPVFYSAFRLEQQSVYTGIVILAFIYPLVDFIISMGTQAISRAYESEADRFAAKTTGDPASMASALKKLSATNLSNLTPHPFYVFLRYSHPPLLQRLKTIEEAASDR